jgi:hypothetical protein
MSINYFCCFLFKGSVIRNDRLNIKNDVSNTPCLEVNVSDVVGSRKVSLHCLVNSVDVQHICQNVLEERDEEGCCIFIRVSLVIIEVVDTLSKRNTSFSFLSSLSYDSSHVENCIIHISVE